MQERLFSYLEAMQVYINSAKEQLTEDNWCTLDEAVKNTPLTKKIIQGFTYREHAIWDFGKAKTAELCFETRHKVLLVATKGDNFPEPKLKKASVYQERSEATEVKPKYYYETIERMFPGCNFLDVFSAEPCNSKWKTLFNKDEEEKDNEEN